MVPADAAAAKEAELKEQVLAHFNLGKFAKYEIPDDVLCWDEIPMTTTGKLDKKNVRAKLEEEGYVLPDLRAKASKSRL